MKYKMMLVFGPFSPASTANSEIIQHRQIVHGLPSAPAATQFARPFLISRYDNALNSHECDSLCLFAVPMALIHKLREYYFIDFAFFPFDLGAMTFMLICFVACVHSRHKKIIWGTCLSFSTKALISGAQQTNRILWIPSEPRGWAIENFQFCFWIIGFVSILTRDLESPSDAANRFVTAKWLDRPMHSHPRPSNENRLSTKNSITIPKPQSRKPCPAKHLLWLLFKSDGTFHHSFQIII